MLIIYILNTVLQTENQMLIRRNPETVAAPPNGRYSHSVETPENSRWLHIAGQVGINQMEQYLAPLKNKMIKFGKILCSFLRTQVLDLMILSK